MQVDARLRAGDVDGPAVYIGKLTNEDGSAYAGRYLSPTPRTCRGSLSPLATTARAICRLADRATTPTALPLDVTATGSTLVYDGDIYTGNGQIAGWTINSTQIVSADGDLTLDKDAGIEVYMQPGAIDDVKRLFTLRR